MDEMYLDVPLRKVRDIQAEITLIVKVLQAHGFALGTSLEQNVYVLGGELRAFEENVRAAVAAGPTRKSESKTLPGGNKSTSLAPAQHSEPEKGSSLGIGPARPNAVTERVITCSCGCGATLTDDGRDEAGKLMPKRRKR